MLQQLYQPALALLTDLYQLTMAYGYWKSGRQDEEAVFHLFFRRAPFGQGYAIACGLAYVVEYLRDFRFTEDDLAYLAGLLGNNGQPLFDAGFVDYLAELSFTCDIDAVEEGEAVFAQEPMIRVRGPLLQCQLLETPLLNLVNFQTLIATKAARVVAAAEGEAVLEFGLRRAQGIDGAVTAARAAYVGGCAATSNLLAGRLFGIPVKGTHAHSWVMSFDSEPEAFEAYADALPNNCVFLVDTYDTKTGVLHAIESARKLRERGHEVVGIRLDSGDLAELSILARQLLDEAGFPDAAIVGSGDLDEHEIRKLKARGAKIAVWGVGTQLVTAQDCPALGGVYKIAALRASPDVAWRYCMKVSDTPGKSTIPGVHQVRRVVDPETGRPLKDILYCETLKAPAEEGRDLLVPVFRGGRLVYEFPGLEAARNAVRRSQHQFGASDEADEGKGKRDSATYEVGLEPSLAALKERLTAEYSGQDV